MYLRGIEYVTNFVIWLCRVLVWTLVNNMHNYKTRHLGLGRERESANQEDRVRIAEQLLVIEQWENDFIP